MCSRGPRNNDCRVRYSGVGVFSPENIGRVNVGKQIIESKKKLNKKLVFADGKKVTSCHRPTTTANNIIAIKYVILCSTYVRTRQDSQ